MLIQGVWELAWIEAQQAGMTERAAGIFVARAAEHSLTPAERIVVLRLLSGWSYKEIAVDEGTSLSTVHNQMSAVKEKLYNYDRTNILLYLTGVIHGMPDRAKYRDLELRQALGVSAA